MTSKKQFEHQGISYSYYEVGEGDKHILVLHGWGSKFSSWETFFNVANQSEYTFYFPELPGFGDSPNPPEAWGLDDYLEYCQSFYKSLKDKPEYLLVHSFGGRIAIKWLSGKNPFKKAIFVGAAGVKPKDKLHKKFVQKISSKLKKFENQKIIGKPLKFAKKIIVKLLGAQDYQNATGTLKQTFLNVIKEDLTNLLHRIKIPVKLVWGKHDTYTPVYMAKIMNDLIPESDLTILPDAKHGVHMQTPEKLAKILDLWT